MIASLSTPKPPLAATMRKAISYPLGRESQSEFGESFAPEEADDKTMGICFGWYAHEHGEEVPFVPFDWARKIEHCHDLPWGADNHKGLSASAPGCSKLT